MNGDDKLDQVLAAVSDLRADVAGLAAWIKADRERIDRIDASLIALRSSHAHDLERVHAKLVTYATRDEVADLESELVGRQRWIVGLLVTILVALVTAAISLAPHLAGSSP